MHTVQAKGVNDACFQVLQKLDTEGFQSRSDKGTTLALSRVLVEVDDPTDRYLTLIGRNYNVYAMIAESIWVLAGTKQINPWLSKFLPRAKDFSDDGHTWYRGYGPMLYQNDQWQGCIDYLSKSAGSRQAVLSIFDPAQESFSACKANVGTAYVKDRSCNNMIYFYTELENKSQLSIHLNNRSNDNMWGAWTINMPEFALIQEITAELLDMDMGVYSVYQNNSHVYMENEIVQKQFRSIMHADGRSKVLTDPRWDFSEEPIMDLGKMTTANCVREWSTDLISLLSQDEPKLAPLVNLMDHWCIQEGTKLHNYAMILYCHLTGSSLSYNHLGKRLATAIEHSKFRKHNVVWDN